MSDDGFDAQLFRAIAGHDQHVGVLEAQRAEVADPVGVGQPAGGEGSHVPGGLDLVAFHVVGPDGAGVVDIDADVPGGQGVKRHR